MPYADPADYRAYVLARKPLYDRRAKEWRSRNRARVKAHDRLRYLRSKSELTEGEIEQCAEICRQYPKRRISYGRN